MTSKVMWEARWSEFIDSDLRPYSKQFVGSDARIKCKLFAMQKAVELTLPTLKVVTVKIVTTEYTIDEFTRDSVITKINDESVDDISS